MRAAIAHLAPRIVIPGFFPEDRPLFVGTVRLKNKKAIMALVRTGCVGPLDWRRPKPELRGPSRVGMCSIFDRRPVKREPPASRVVVLTPAAAKTGARPCI